VRAPLDAAKPTAVICHTVKGKGFPFAENNAKWHHHTNFDAAVIKDMNDAVGAIL
jgi:transketolase